MGSTGFVDELLHKEISLKKAFAELKRLQWENRDCIGFTNEINGDVADFVRADRDEWDVQVPVFKGGNWTGSHYIAKADTEKILEMTRLFFEGRDWFGALDFELSKTI